MHGGMLYNYFGGLVVAWATSGMLMLVVQSGAIGVAYQPAGGRGANGAFQLLDPFDRLHHALLRLRLRLLRRHQPHGAGGHRADHLGFPALDQPDLAQALPVRPGGMALAIADLLEASADASVIDAALSSGYGPPRADRLLSSDKSC